MPPASEFSAGSQSDVAQFKSRPRKIMSCLFQINQLALSDCSTSGQQCPWVKKNCYQSIRTIQNFMAYTVDAEMSKTYISYNPNKKNATVAYLDSPEDKAPKTSA